MGNLPTAIKFFSITGAALVTTVFCFFVMYLLIRTGLEQAPEPDPPRLAAPQIKALEEIEMPETRKRVSRLLPADPPPDPEGIPISPDEVVVIVKAPRPTLGSISEVLNQEAFDFEPFPPLSDLFPLYVVQPTYPFTAVMKEIEGFVIVNFSVRENGSVLNPIVLESEPETLFDEAAISAISKFKFQPRMIGGDAVGVQDMQLKFVFRLTQGEATAVIDSELVPRESSDYDY